jgi:signal transduction histidine kinase
VIRNSLLVAGAIGLGVAILVGVIGQLRYTGRIRRLERAAERIAAGDLGQPVPHEGDDEVGQLATAMERMRVQLDQLEAARRAFIANASHELKTPLFALGGFLELMSDDDVDESTRREFTEQMRGQVDRLTRLTVDLLDLSRLDAGQLELASEPLDLAEAARAVVDQFGPAAEASGHDLAADAAHEVTALGDEGRVLRIAGALVENALRHTPAHSRIGVRAAIEDGRAVLVVEDDGPGIPAEELPHVFERFYRGTNGIAHGSGLGLSIARELAQLMGGTLTVRSRPGESVFVLALPLGRPALSFPRGNVESVTAR